MNKNLILAFALFSLPVLQKKIWGQANMFVTLGFPAWIPLLKFCQNPQQFSIMETISSFKCQMEINCTLQIWKMLMMV